MGQNKKAILKTGFGTTLNLLELSPREYIVTKKITTVIDTPHQEIKGTKNTFLEGAKIKGNLWKETDDKQGKQRNVVMVQADGGRYLLPVDVVELVDTEKEEIKKELETLKGDLEKYKDQAKEHLSGIKTETKDLFDKEVFGLKVKQLLLIGVGILIIKKL